MPPPSIDWIVLMSRSSFSGHPCVQLLAVCAVIMLAGCGAGSGPKSSSVMSSRAAARTSSNSKVSKVVNPAELSTRPRGEALHRRSSEVGEANRRYNRTKMTTAMKTGEKSSTWRSTQSSHSVKGAHWHGTKVRALSCMRGHVSLPCTATGSPRQRSGQHPSSTVR